MRYWKVTCSNGYLNCEEEFYIEAETENEAESVGDEILYGGEYSFWEPDGRFIDEDSENWEDEVEEYQENCSFWVEEITKEEYDEYERWLNS